MFPRETVPAGPVVLRELTAGDADAIVRACADPEIVRFLPALPVPYTRDDAFAFLKSSEREWEAGGATFAVADPGTGAWLGNVGLKPPGPRGGVEIGYLIAPWARGRGAATAAARALTEWAFAHGTHRVELLAEVENLASQRVALAAGFAHEGMRRGDHPMRDGSRGDLVSFARLRADSGERVRPYLPPLPGGSLSDGVVRLTPLTAADAADRLALESLPDVMEHHVPPEVPDPAENETFCREAGMRWLAGSRAELVIRDAAGGAFAGSIQLAMILPPLGQAMTGYSLRPEFRGRGFATRAVNLLVEWAFTHTGLARIVAGTDPGNTASHRVLERAGFTRDAVLHGFLPGPGGVRRDDLQWYRLRPGGGQPGF
ncbi:GNAT family N-acetyltransferase [Planobispora longispora]|uniref:N-acetyltransferase domain-containing protein n=1 Tax=Planobispora longispora TaxID=28887 RepID=A0A8J3W5L9_9ACTN|nr:GNAT family protein [Planobispora longispora]GIH76922.1 hypothetical protein Plo01_33510 [Planobispora longispora]